MYELSTMRTLFPLLHPALSLPSAAGLMETGAHSVLSGPSLSPWELLGLTQTPQPGLPHSPEQSTWRCRHNEPNARFSLTLEEKTQVKKHGTKLDFIPWKQTLLCDTPVTKPLAPNCIMSIIPAVPFVEAVMAARMKNEWVTALLLSHLTFRFTVV